MAINEKRNSCSFPLAKGEEWLLVLYKGSYGGCGATALLANGSQQHFPNEPWVTYDYTVARYAQGAEWLRTMRAVAESQPRNADGTFPKPPGYDPVPLVAPLSWQRGEAPGPFL